MYLIDLQMEKKRCLVEKKQQNIRKKTKDTQFNWLLALLELADL